MKAKVLILLAVLAALIFPVSARADGIIVPHPPICDPACPPPPCPRPGFCPPPSPMQQLAIKSHHVRVTIQDQVAVTHVDQVFYNPNNGQVEGTYMFPLPAEAAVTSFTLWIDGQPVSGKVLDAKQARQQYQDIVNRLRDPALLEYVGRGAVQANIFPIPPKGERRIELEYSQPLAADNGLVRYVYPLNTEKFSTQPLESVSVSVEISSTAPLRAVYSPSHPVSISRQDEHHIRAGYEAANVRPDSDFSLYYSLGADQAFHLLTFRDPSDSGDPDGFFLLLLAARPDTAGQSISKDVILVLDRSGSMDGEKFRQAQEALRYILKHLSPGDRFNAIAFSTGLESFANELQPASQAQAALSWVDHINAQGSTDINRALLEASAMADRSRPTYLIFLTDGLPTEGVTDSAAILKNLAAAAPSNVRLFPFGVGYDVDTYLLDGLAQEHHGASTYVQPGERLDEALSGFYARISTPVLTDLALDFGGLPVYDLYPSPLPDLFAGSQVILVGRYRQAGSADVRLSGNVNGEPQAFTYAGQVFPASSDAAAGQGSPLPRLWATRKVGYLLNQARLKGPDQETIDQIVKLSIRYGIVTPYTSYLVTEPLPLGASAQADIAHRQYSQMLAAPTASSSGADAVQKAAGQGAMAAAQAPAALPPAEQDSSGLAASPVRSLGSHTFVLKAGQWIDTAFDPQAMQTVKVSFLSKDYFALADGRPDLAAAFALGPSVIAVSGGKAYEVVPAGIPVAPLPATPAAAPPVTATSAPTPAAATVVPTPAPPTTAPSPTPESPSETPQASKSTFPCTAGLLPLAALAAWFVLTRLQR